MVAKGLHAAPADTAATACKSCGNGVRYDCSVIQLCMCATQHDMACRGHATYSTCRVCCVGRCGWRCWCAATTASCPARCANRRSMLSACQDDPFPAGVIKIFWRSAITRRIVASTQPEEKASRIVLDGSTTYRCSTRRVAPDTAAQQQHRLRTSSRFLRKCELRGW